MEYFIRLSGGPYSMVQAVHMEKKTFIDAARICTIIAIIIIITIIVIIIIIIKLYVE